MRSNAMVIENNKNNKLYYNYHMNKLIVFLLQRNFGRKIFENEVKGI